MRTQPQCPHFGVCGGCACSTWKLRAQVAAKQRVLEDDLWHIAKVKPETMLPPIYGPAWGYRHRARLRGALCAEERAACWSVSTKKRSSYVAGMHECEVLPPHISALIVPLQDLLASSRSRDRMPQSRGGRRRARVGAGVPHPGAAMTPEDEPLLMRIRRPARRAGLAADARARKPPSRSIRWMRRSSPIRCPNSISIYPFKPTEFTQVNPQINRVLVRRAMRVARSAAGRAHRRPVLRPGQFHAADRAHGRYRARHGRFGGAGAARPGKCRAQRPRRTRPSSARPTCSR